MSSDSARDDAAASPTLPSPASGGGFEMRGQSCEDAVDEPACRLVGPIESGAEQPEAAALLILDAVIVADPAGIAKRLVAPGPIGVPPPFGGHPPRPLLPPPPRLHPAP